MRDIFHREWNDVRLSIKDCNLWHIVILSAVAFNLPYGPWDGSTWFGKLQISAEEHVQLSAAGGPLFSHLYP
eukprot:2345491-Lingulodinium_polyedra.AAC.1